MDVGNNYTFDHATTNFLSVNIFSSYCLKHFMSVDKLLDSIQQFASLRFGKPPIKWKTTTTRSKVSSEWMSEGERESVININHYSLRRSSMPFCIIISRMCDHNWKKSFYFASHFSSLLNSTQLLSDCLLNMSVQIDIAVDINLLTQNMYFSF